MHRRSFLASTVACGFACSDHLQSLSTAAESSPFNIFSRANDKIVAREKLPEGKVNIQLLSELENGPASALNITIKVNGKEVAKGKVPRSIASTISYNDGFDIGQDLGSPVSDAYFDNAPFTFNGQINKVVARYLE